MGDAKMVNMLTTPFSWYFLKFYTLKMCDQHFARFLSFSVHSWIPLLFLIFFFSSGFEINFYLRISCDTVNSPLTNTSLRRTTPGVGPCHCPVIWLNYALYKGGNLSKKDNRHFQNRQRPLEKCFRWWKNTAKRKCRCTSWRRVIAIRISKLHTHSKYSTRLLTSRIF